MERKNLPDGSVLESQWSYGVNGNRVEEGKPDGTLLTASCDAQDRIVSSGDFTFTHSHNGEMLTKCQGDFFRLFVL